MAACIIEAGCDAFGDIPSALLVPLVSLVMITLNFALWVFIMISILGDNVVTTGKPSATFLPDVTLTSGQQWLIA